MSCSIERKNEVLDIIQNTILFEDNLTNEVLESAIKESGEGEFTLSNFLSNLSDDELEDLKGLMEMSGLDTSVFLEKTKAKVLANRSGVISRLYSPSNVLDLFHNQSYLEKRFIN